MTYPEIAPHAAQNGDRTAFGVVDGQSVTFAELNARSCALADALHAGELRAGDVMAVVVDNRIEWAEIVWAGLRSGLLIALIDHHARATDLRKLLSAVAPAAIVVAPEMTDVACDDSRIVLTASRPTLHQAAVRAPSRHEPRAGARLAITSGTTGPPKIIREPLPEGDDPPIRLAGLMERLGIDGRSVVLSPGPCYHSAPYGFHTTVQRLGGTALTMVRFDVDALARCVAAGGVTHLHLVPTMLYRLLKAPEAVRDDLRAGSSEAIVLGGVTP